MSRSKELRKNPEVYPPEVQQRYGDLALHVSAKGGVVVRLRNDMGYYTTTPVAHLVWNHHYPDKPLPKGAQVLHLNGDKMNNTVTNLYWKGAYSG